ncbi:MAG: T9SS type A sorting domain-containing protein [Saprospiraceae bacterium]|nr:T9SS type A sorting domain-containing protein [Saprospiraceae bacterium]
MKPLLLLLFLTLISHQIHAQEYVPMAVDSATWRLGTTGEYPESDNLIVLRIEGDTMVNEMVYGKIYHYDMEDNILIQDSRRLLGLLRDEMDEKKVFGGILESAPYEFLNEDVACDWGDSDTFKEQLLYDFSLQEGDMLNSCMFLDSSFITSIDTVSTFGFQRRRLKLNGDIPHTLTEGIGTCMGIFKGENCVIAGGYYAYSLFDYCIGDFSFCNLATATKEENVLDQMVVYPNPVSDLLTIESPVTLSRLTLLDAQGRIMDTTTNTSTINFTNYLPGIYMIQAEDKQGGIYTKRVVKL